MTGAGAGADVQDQLHQAVDELIVRAVACLVDRLAEERSRASCERLPAQPFIVEGGDEDHRRGAR